MTSRVGTGLCPGVARLGREGVDAARSGGSGLKGESGRKAERGRN